MTRALVLGKFLPPHLGHQFLIDFARSYRVDGEPVDLTVLVATLPSEGIPGTLRHQWLKEHYAACPNVRVVHADEVVPQDPSEHPDFWSIWVDLIVRHAGTGFDLVFASEDYGSPLAGVLGATFVPVDIAREIMPVSGTAVRAEPGFLFPWMIPEARRHFAKRVVLFGAESVGKTTMARRLATTFATVWLPEWARGYLDVVGPDVTAAKIEAIARGQMAMEDAARAQAMPLLLQDTDLIATVAWSDILLGSHPDWIEEEAIRRRADLYLVLDDNVAFVADDQRYGGDRRQMTTAQAIAYLERFGCRYVVVRDAAYAERQARCAEIVSAAESAWFAAIPQYRPDHSAALAQERQEQGATE